MEKKYNITIELGGAMTQLSFRNDDEYWVVDHDNYITIKENDKIVHQSKVEDLKLDDSTHIEIPSWFSDNLVSSLAHKLNNVFDKRNRLVKSAKNQEFGYYLFIMNLLPSPGSKSFVKAEKNYGKFLIKDTFESDAPFDFNKLTFIHMDTFQQFTGSTYNFSNVLYDGNKAEFNVYDSNIKDGSKESYLKSTSLFLNEDIATNEIVGGLSKQKISNQDRELVLKLVSANGLYLEFASDNLKSDKEVALAALKQNGRAFEFVSDDLKSDKEIVLNTVHSYGGALEYVSKELQGDKEIVIAAVTGGYWDGQALEFAAKELKGDKEVVLAAVRSGGEALAYSSKNLQKDKEVVLEAVKNISKYYKGGTFHIEELFNESINKQFLKDKDIMLAAVNTDGNSLQFASQTLRSDREIALAAFNNLKAELSSVHKYGLKVIDKKFLNDSELMLSALKHAKGDHSQFYPLISENLKADKEFMTQAIYINGNSIQYASEKVLEELKSDREIILAAVKESVYNLEYASEELRGDKEIVTIAIMGEGCCLKYASEELKGNREIVLAGVKTSWCLKFASEELKTDKEFIIAAVKIYATGCGSRFESEIRRLLEDLSEELYDDNDFEREFVSTFKAFCRA